MRSRRAIQQEIKRLATRAMTDDTLKPLTHGFVFLTGAIWTLAWVLGSKEKADYQDFGAMKLWEVRPPRARRIRQRTSRKRKESA